MFGRFKNLIKTQTQKFFDNVIENVLDGAKTTLNKIIEKTNISDSNKEEIKKEYEEQLDAFKEDTTEKFKDVIEDDDEEEEFYDADNSKSKEPSIEEYDQVLEELFTYYDKYIQYLEEEKKFADEVLEEEEDDEDTRLFEELLKDHPEKFEPVIETPEENATAHRIREIERNNRISIEGARIANELYPLIYQWSEAAWNYFYDSRDEENLEIYYEAEANLIYFLRNNMLWNNHFLIRWVDTKTVYFPLTQNSLFTFIDIIQSMGHFIDPNIEHEDDYQGNPESSRKFIHEHFQSMELVDFYRPKDNTNTALAMTYNTTKDVDLTRYQYYTVTDLKHYHDNENVGVPNIFTHCVTNSVRNHYIKYDLDITEIAILNNFIYGQHLNQTVLNKIAIKLNKYITIHYINDNRYEVKYINLEGKVIRKIPENVLPENNIQLAIFDNHCFIYEEVPYTLFTIKNITNDKIRRHRIYTKRNGNRLIEEKNKKFANSLQLIKAMTDNNLLLPLTNEMKELHYNVYNQEKEFTTDEQGKEYITQKDLDYYNEIELKKVTIKDQEELKEWYHDESLVSINIGDKETYQTKKGREHVDNMYSVFKSTPKDWTTGRIKKRIDNYCFDPYALKQKNMITYMGKDAMVKYYNKEVNSEGKHLFYHHNHKYDLSGTLPKICSITDQGTVQKEGEIYKISGIKKKDIILEFRDSLKFFNSSLKDAARNYKIKYDKELIYYSLYNEDTNNKQRVTIKDIATSIKTDKRLHNIEKIKKFLFEFILHIEEVNVKIMIDYLYKQDSKKEFTDIIDDLSKNNFKRMNKFTDYIENNTNELFRKFYRNKHFVFLSTFKDNKNLNKIDEEITLDNISKSQLIFNHMAYLRYYCERDVLVTTELLYTFRNMSLKELSVDPFSTLTCSSLAQRFVVQEGCYEGCTEVTGTVLKYLSGFVAAGRTMTRDNKSHHVKLDTTILDFVSLYPSSLVRLKGVPKGTLKRITNYDYEFIKNNYSEYFVTIKIKKFNKKPSMPNYYKIENNAKVWTNEVQEGTIFKCGRIALEDLIRFDGLEFEIIDGMGYPKEQGYNTNIRSLVNKLYNLRKIRKENKDPAEAVYKLMLVSIYGKTLLKAMKYKTHYIRGAENMRNFVIKNSFLIRPHKGIVLLDKGSKPEWNKYAATVYVDQLDHKNISPFGIMILEMSKRIMNEVVECMDENNIPWFYTDTDSLHVPRKYLDKIQESFKEKYNRDLFGYDLQQMHPDLKIEGYNNLDVNKIYSKESVFISKKLYRKDLRYDDDENIRGIYGGSKGIPKDLIENKADEYENSLDLFLCNEKIEVNLCDSIRPKFKFDNYFSKVRTLENFKRSIDFRSKNGKIVTWELNNNEIVSC